MIETKVMRIENSESAMNSVSKVRSCFGWTVANVQVTHSENTRTYSSAWDQLGGNQSQTVETNVVDYATVTLQRETTLAHYRRLCDLEEEYEREGEHIMQIKNDKVKCEKIETAWQYFFWPISGIVYRILCKGNISRLEKAAIDLKQVENRRQAILNQARELLG